MVLTAAGLHVLLLAVSTTATGALAGYAWRRRREPGALPFAALMVALTVWSGSYAVGLLTLDPRWRPFWEAVQWFGTATVPVPFLLFALEYTGHDEFVTRRATALLSIVPALTVVLVWTNGWHHLVWIENSVVVLDGIALMEARFGPWFWVALAYSYALIGLGSVLVLRLVVVSDYLFADQSALLLVGVTAPVAGNVVAVFVETPALPGIDVTPYAFAVTGVAFGYALFRHRLFELVPATRQLGRNAAIRQLDDGVVIVDTARQVVYCNPAAADILDCDAEAVLGRPVRALVTDLDLDFDAEEALASLERDERTYEVRTSPVRDRRDRVIGHTLLVHDVTARERRERELARQRDELATVNELNAVIRGVNSALVSSTTRDAVERAVCDRLANSDLYRTAYAADIPTWRGDADRWTVAGGGGDPLSPTDLDGDTTPAGLVASVETVDSRSGTPVEGTRTATVETTGPGTWVVVPLAYGPTVYGALGLFTERGTVSERERSVLTELGDLIGHTIDAVGNRQLLAADSVVELELGSRDAALATAAAATDCCLELVSVVPAGDGDHLAYVTVDEDGGDGTVAEGVRAGLGETGGSARVVRGGEQAVVEWGVGADTLLGALADHGANVRSASADDGTARYVVEVASDADVRALLDRVRASCPETWLDAKRERDRPPKLPSLPGDSLDGLTDRQREVLEAAYRAGYFEWPRESTAEEVADSVGVSAPTLHGHLRKGERSLFDRLFDASSD